MPKNVKLIIEYDGTNYAGWQRQENALAVQQVIEECINKLVGGDVKIIGSGRTDAGAHARGQVANFITSATIPAERYSFALNTFLPRDIKILSSEEVDLDFDSRFSAKGKKYRYSILLNKHGTAIGYQYAYHLPYSLDIESMEEAAVYYIGTHDFSAFKARGSSVKTNVRTIYESELIYEPPYLDFVVKGDGFLYNMVRIMVGTLIEVGRGKLKPYLVKEIMDSKNRSKSGPTAPAHGLFLEEVYYG